MKRNNNSATILILLMLLSFVSLSLALAENPTSTAVIQPQADNTVSQVTTIAGTVDFDNFERYEIFLNNGQAMIWAGSAYAPVNNGNLARLDPRVFTDGSYQVIIRQVRTDSNYDDFTGPTIYISNPLGAPQAYYPDVEPSYLYPSANKAVVRVKNCSGYDIDFDYNSPQGGRSGGATRLMPHKDGYICTYEDLGLVPGSYQGTIREEGREGKGYQFDASAGKVYELAYNGIEAGNNQIIFNEVKPDDMMASDVMMMTETTNDTPTEALVGGGAMAEEAPAAKVETTEKVLPVSGQATVSQAPYLLFALMFVVLMLVGGVIALQRSRYMA